MIIQSIKERGRKLAAQRAQLMLILWNLAVLAVCLMLFHPHFEEIDDLKMSYIVEGVYGFRDAHLVYSNYLLGLVLKALYGLWPGMRWYTVYLYAAAFVSLVVITWLFTFKTVTVGGVRLGNRKAGAVVSGIFLLCFAWEAYVSLQYTKIAMMVCAAGYLLLFYALRERRRRALCAGMLLVWFGSLMRLESFLLATAFMAGVGVYETWHYVKRPRQYRQLLLRYVLVFFLLFAAVFAAKAYDGSRYQNDGWAEFTDFNSARTSLNDYHYDILDYSANGRQLAAAGITENDAKSYLTWQFGDTEVFTTEYVEDILRLPVQERALTEKLKALAANLFTLLYSLNGFTLGTVCVLLSVLLLRQRHLYPLTAYLLLLLAGVHVYYQLSGRFNHRVVMIAWFALLVILLQYLDRRPAKLLSFILGLMLFTNAGLLLQDTFDYREYRRTYSYEAGLLKDFTMANKDKLYVIDTFADQYSYQYEIFTCLGEGAFSNRISTGGWLTGSPIEKAVLESFGVENPYRALAEEPERIFLVDKQNVSDKETYLNEHYGQEYGLLKAVQADHISVETVTGGQETSGSDGFYIYQFRQKDAQAER